MGIEVYIGLGSNLSDPVYQVRTALVALAQIPETELIDASSLYRSAPMGPQDQSDYINAVAKLSTSLAPLALLDQLQAIEQVHGRERKDERWGPRTLDLDLLLYGDQMVDVPRLQVPHYGIAERSFVLLPLQELVGDEFAIPKRGKVSDLIAELESPQACEPL